MQRADAGTPVAADVTVEIYSDPPGAAATALLQRLASEAQAESDGTDLSRRALKALGRERDIRDDDLSLLTDAAVAWGRTQSVSVRFATRRGVVDRPRAGERYRHP